MGIPHSKHHHDHERDREHESLDAMASNSQQPHRGEREHRPRHSQRGLTLKDLIAINAERESSGDTNAAASDMASVDSARTTASERAAWKEKEGRLNEEVKENAEIVKTFTSKYGQLKSVQVFSCKSFPGLYHLLSPQALQLSPDSGAIEALVFQNLVFIERLAPEASKCVLSFFGWSDPSKRESLAMLWLREVVYFGDDFKTGILLQAPRAFEITGAPQFQPPHGKTLASGEIHVYAWHFTRETVDSTTVKIYRRWCFRFSQFGEYLGPSMAKRLFFKTDKEQSRIVGGPRWGNGAIYFGEGSMPQTDALGLMDDSDMSF